MAGEKDILRKREFLNKDHNSQYGLAAIGLESEDCVQKLTNGDILNYHLGTLEITDCSRRIELDFSCSDKESQLNAIEKCDKFIAYAEIMKKRIEEYDFEP